MVDINDYYCVNQVKNDLDSHKEIFYNIIVTSIDSIEFNIEGIANEELFPLKLDPIKFLFSFILLLYWHKIYKYIEKRLEEKVIIMKK